MNQNALSFSVLCLILLAFVLFSGEPDLIDAIIHTMMK